MPIKDAGNFTMPQEVDPSIPARRSHSIRYRVLGPIIATSLFTAIFVASISYLLGSRRARADVQERYQAVRNVVLASGFPLSDTVLGLISEMTGTELQSVTDDGVVIDETLAESLTEQELEIRYQIFRINLRAPTSGLKPASSIRVLFDRQQLWSTTRNAALLPLVTGFSTLIVLSTVTLLLTNQLVKRLLNLQRKVAAIASRQLASHQPAQPMPSAPAASDDSMRRINTSNDELGMLENAVDALSNQLKQLWIKLRRKQSEQLLYQLASGMAHQLRNSLTGARMAIELHADQCQSADRETLDVALAQILQTDGYVQRLLLVGKRKPEPDHPEAVESTLDQMRVGIETIASHRSVNLSWEFETDDLGCTCVANGQLFSDAVSNLVLNAIEAGKNVRVQIGKQNDGVVVRVFDDGPGIEAELEDSLCEPFVTSKPEGLGLGLSLAQRAANSLGGSLRWERQGAETMFTLNVASFEKNTTAAEEPNAC